MRQITAFGPLAAQYDGFIVDLWGVIHDGAAPYAGAAECLRALRDAGKRVVLLSNAPRRAARVVRQLEAMGIGGDCYAGVMTSGEATHLMLRDRPEPWYAALGRRVLHIGPERDRNVLDGLDYEVVPEGADFVLNTGPDDRAGPVDIATYDPVLEAAAAAGLPMICANPDLSVIANGVEVACAGALAVRYGALGGDVRSLGKPDPAIYAPVMATLGLPPARVLAVGDALRTDIAGAKAVGVDACWVLGGLHGAHRAGPAAVKAEAEAMGLAPVAAVPRFVW